MQRPSRALDLPPPFRPVILREAGDAFAYACAHAAELGAGILAFVGRFDAAEFAVVLEPEEPLASARRSFYAGMTALVDALSALAPPETPIAIEWPDRIEIGRGLVGGGRLGWPDNIDEHARPDWLVFGALVRLFSTGRRKAGPDPPPAVLADEGFFEIGSERLAEGFARHLMAVMDRWQEDDFAAVEYSYLARLRTPPGVQPRIDGTGNLQIARPGGRVELNLRAALATPSRLGPFYGSAP